MFLSPRKLLRSIWRLPSESINTLLRSWSVDVWRRCDFSFPFLVSWIGCAIYAYLSFQCPELYECSSFVRILFKLLVLIMVLSFLYTGVYDPGVIRSTEENSLARGSVLESQKYSYCSLCDLYRPEGAKHCPKCGVCLYNCDHHCIVMG